MLHSFQETQAIGGIDVLKTFRTTLNHMTSDLTLNHFIFCYLVNLEQPLHHLSNFIPERCDTSDNYGLPFLVSLTSYGLPFLVSLT
uniref:Uncharacterized protein n=1 Tax=Manihot esculenta TaxID=3983 RepID=A0A2C9VP88_MANES